MVAGSESEVGVSYWQSHGSPPRPYVCSISQQGGLPQGHYRRQQAGYSGLGLGAAIYEADAITPAREPRIRSG